jgi:hypothetical protein
MERHDRGGSGTKDGSGAGVIPRVNPSVKVTALTLLLRPHAPDRAGQKCPAASRLRAPA